MTILERVQSLESQLTLNGNYEYELQELSAIEQEIPVYRRLGTPLWKTERAKEEITRIREWIAQEIA